MECLQQDIASLRLCRPNVAAQRSLGRRAHPSRYAPAGRSFRCQAAPDGSGKSLFNLRAWGQGLFNNLRLGFAEQKRAPEGQSQPETAEQPGSSGDSRDSSKGQEAAEVTLLPALRSDETSWDGWQEYFHDMDGLYEHACEMESAMEGAIEAEDYESAAKYKREYEEIRRLDVVDEILHVIGIQHTTLSLELHSYGMLHQELKTALAQEDYGRAAELRDAGCAGLIGWWHSRAEGDPHGHLLRISPDFGRYTAVMYSPRDFAEIKGWNNEPTYSAPLGTMGWHGPPEEVQVAMEPSVQETGVPVMEIFVRRDSAGRLHRQACVVRADKHAEADGADGQGQQLFAALDEGPQPTMDIHVSDSTNGNNGVIAMRISFNEDGSPSGVEEMPPIEPMSSMIMGGPLSHEEMMTGLEPDGDQIVIAVDGEHSMSGSSTMQYARTPAAVTRMDNNNFVLTVPALPEEQLPELGPGDVEVDANPHGAQQEALDKLRAAIGLSGTASTSSGVAADPLSGIVVHDSFQQLTDPTKQQDGDAASTSNQTQQQRKDIDAWTRAAKEVKRLHSARNPDRPMPISGDELADVIRSAARGALDMLQQQNYPSSFCLQGTTLYNRIQADTPRTDPFTGLYLGTFGPHGPEVLQLQRSFTEDGEECVLGIKLTGDTNVPAGNVSFRAKIGRKHRRSGFDLMYPPELEIVARYAGEGRVAHKGFKDARWVEGELLQFSGNNPVTRGAELGFVWVVPHERRYLILLSRIDLDDPCISA